MRTTLDLPPDLVDEARSAVGFKSKTDTVVFALREVIRRQRIDELKTLMGSIRFEFDPSEIRAKERPPHPEPAPVIVVDTSVWVEATRKPAGDIAATLRALLDADEVALALPVRLELLAGTAKGDRRAFRRAFSALPVLVPTEETWAPLDDWVARAADAGERFAVTDLLIARLADDIGALVWSLDKDFDRMARLKLVRRFEA